MYDLIASETVVFLNRLMLFVDSQGTYFSQHEREVRSNVPDRGFISNEVGRFSPNQHFGEGGEGVSA